MPSQSKYITLFEATFHFSIHYLKLKRDSFWWLNKLIPLQLIQLVLVQQKCEVYFKACSFPLKFLSVFWWSRLPLSLTCLYILKNHDLSFSFPCFQPSSTSLCVRIMLPTGKPENSETLSVWIKTSFQWTSLPQITFPNDIHLVSLGLCPHPCLWHDPLKLERLCKFNAPWSSLYAGSQELCLLILSLLTESTKQEHGEEISSLVVDLSKRFFFYILETCVVLHLSPFCSSKLIFNNNSHFVS